MIPRTKNNLESFACLSALQKCIRRGLEREAMEFACELGHTSKAMFSMLVNRLEIIAHEDIGLAAPATVQFVATAVEQAKRHYDADKQGKWRLMIGNAIRLMCRGPKSREADHYQAAIGLPNLNGRAPTIPDWAYDHHTTKGRKMGRGIEFFKKESATLIPPAESDPYYDEAYREWTKKLAAGADDEHGGNRPLFA